MIYGITAGDGDLADMAICQLRSLHKYTSATRDEIVVNCPLDEWVELSDCKQREIESLSTLYHEPPTIPDYPLSAAHATGLVAVDQAGPNEWVALLDTDTVVLKELDRFTETDAELAVKPADFHYQRVGLDEETLRQAYESTNTTYPEETMRSTVDKEPIIPYWNGGAVFSRTDSFF
ncbi:hypothetical protein [Halorientalis pallida]|uniref:Glycosyl transferase family 8 n=1 Tax=Halorientalis pallida TaxID=2479928 RepID=A0A498KRG7_9EURY|nr:hypothetical protein [Halorientalis pallida]RXK46943.1 hypothetical protein EAF64_17505 [Halorientalis pallida]